MHTKGRVYWITGLKSSGKTTIGTALYYALKKDHDNVLILDGDILKQFVGDTFGYIKEERLARGKRYSQLCKLLVEQGLIVVICTISMFHEIQEWNRKKLKGYIEVFVDTPPEIISTRDKSGLYTLEEIKTNYKEAQLPKDPDIILRNDGTKPITEIVRELLEITPRTDDDFARDQSYWNQYYQRIDEKLLEPSNFAVAVANDISSGRHLLELGCGNGRDSLFFASKGVYVTGVDASDAAIQELCKQVEGNNHAMFICDDFVKCRAVFQRQYDYIYSRFTLHAISDEQESELLLNIKEAMFSDSLLFIEARTIHDDIYGKGEKVEENAYLYDGHFRRFIDPLLFKLKMEKMGYKILIMKEAKGFSKTKESDPTLMRVIACLK